MNYIETIKKNIINFNNIKKLAHEKRIKYEIAKIMYNDGKNDITEEQAKTLIHLTKSLNIPYSLLKELNLFESSMEPYAQYHITRIINQKIANYANKKYIYDLRGIMDIDVLYGQKIVLLTKKTRSIDAAIKLFDLQVKIEMKRTGLSETAATINLLKYHEIFDYTLSKLLDKAAAFNKGNEEEADYTIKKYLIESSDYKRKKIHGIFIVSKTEDGLERLERTIEMLYQNNNSIFLKRLSEEAETYELVITDIKIDEDNLSHYNRNVHIIKITENKPDNIIEQIIYHEATHFLDNVLTYNGHPGNYSFISPEVKETYYKIRENANKLYAKAFSLTYLKNKASQKYINDSFLNKKWLGEIKKKNPYASKEDIDLFLEQKRLYEKKKYYIICDIISDIYDSLKKGKIHDLGIGTGHGSKYYNSEASQLKEFIANIGNIINSGGEDILYFEFGEEIASDIIKMYTLFLQSESNYAYRNHSNNHEEEHRTKTA